jgi:polysaccharide biosynthesis/export protein
MKYLITCLMALMFSFCLHNTGFAAESNYLLGAGDVLKISVYNNPDLELETRVSETGLISYPLIGEVKVGGMTSLQAEKKIADLLFKGGFIKSPQVTILVTQFLSKLVSVLGSVVKPGRYPLDRPTNLADLLAQAGGITPDGSNLITVVTKSGKIEYDMRDLVDTTKKVHNVEMLGGEVVYVHTRDISVMGQVNRPGKYSVTDGVRTVADFLTAAGGVTEAGSEIVTVTTVRDGTENRFDVDIDSLFRKGDKTKNIDLMSGDSIYVPRAPMVYIYGEVQRPGAYRVERNMTVVQALALGGGPTVRGTQRSIKLYRRNQNSTIDKTAVELTDSIKPDDVLYVEESIF